MCSFPLRYVEVPRCSAVPKTECKDITRTVVDTKCTEIPKQQCVQVPKQTSVEVPIEIVAIDRDEEVQIAL